MVRLGWIVWVVTAWSLGCAPSGALVAGDDDTAMQDDDTNDDDTASDDDVSDDDTDDDDTATDDDTDDPSDYEGCSFETGDLTGFGHPGSDWWVSEEGGMVVIFAEGDDFSGLVGEEDLEFTGDFAALLRSNEQADPDTWGHLVTDAFVPLVPTLIFDQLSEVDDRGIELEVAILDPDGTVLEQQSLPVETGGFVPGLPPGGLPFEDFPEITVGGGQAGEFVRHEIDLTPYWQSQQTIQVRFRQHTTLDGVGFFTLLDNVCNMAF